MLPLPHTCTIKRQTYTGPHYTSEATVYTAAKCLFSPASSESDITPFGPFENYEYLLFLDPTLVVKRNDIVINEADSSAYIIMEPPKMYQNPITWVNDHWECKLNSHLT